MTKRTPQQKKKEGFLLPSLPGGPGGVRTRDHRFKSCGVHCCCDLISSVRSGLTCAGYRWLWRLLGVDRLVERHQSRHLAGAFVLE